jgi:hypothetical protein
MTKENNEANSNNDAYVRRFSFRPFEGVRRGRFYRLFSISWFWWVHQWERSRSIKILVGFLAFIFVLQNLFVLALASTLTGPFNGTQITTNELLESSLFTMVRGIVTLETTISTSNGNGYHDEFQVGGLSIFILILVTIVGSGLIADDISNKTNEIYYSKLEKYEYVFGKFGAFLIFGNISIVLPFIGEFFLLAIGLRGVDFFTVFPVLIQIIIFTEIVVVTYASIILAFSSLTNRRLYAGLFSFMGIFVLDMIIPSLAISGNREVNPVILLDILTVLLIFSYILRGTTVIEAELGWQNVTINLVDGIGIESWMVIGALGTFILIGILIVTIQIFVRHGK